MKNIFYDSKDIFNVNNSITISIGTITKCNKGITDVNFQNIISDLIFVPHYNISIKKIDYTTRSVTFESF